jgi:hypothetical protein
MRWRPYSVLVGVFCTIAVPLPAAAPTPEGPDGRPAAVPVRHRAEGGGWWLAETAHFRVHHRGSWGRAEQAARAAERTRRAALHRWFADADAGWDSPCDLYLYPTAMEYYRQTGAPPTAPGHTRVRDDGGRVVAREVHLHEEVPDLLRTVLPHEVTHAVLAGRFGDRRVPRWADEGMAVLAEPAAQVARHLRDLPRWRDDGLLFGARELVEMPDYPSQPYRVGAFYSESVSLVRFLSGVRGPEEFTRFVRDGLRAGYAASLRRHYGWDFAELQHRWLADAFGADDAVGE